MPKSAMSRSVKPIPEGYHTVTPYLVVPGAAKIIDFLKRTFDATERGERHLRPDGGIMHAEVKLGDSVIMLGEPMGEQKAMPCTLYLYVKDVDAAYRRGIEAGATSLREPSDQFYGDRTAGLQDGSGNQWWIGTHIEDVSPDELKRRAQTQAG